MAGFDPSDDRLAHEAEELMRQRRFSDAASRYGELLTKMPTDLWASLGRVSALECAGQLDEARSLLEALNGSHRRSASFQRFRHLFFVRREDHRAAISSQQVLRAEVVDEGADDQLADLYFNQGRYHEAAGELERLLAGGLEDGDLKASVLARLGACQRQLGDAQTARGNLLGALALEPNNHWTLSELAEAERALGNVDAARTRYLESLAASPDDHWTRGHLAQLEFENGDAEAAIALYREILVRDPQAAWAHVELAQVLTESDPAQSATLCQAALDRDPKNPWAHAQLGALARRRGDYAAAREHYQRAHQGAPMAVWILHELADCYRHLGQLDAGHALLRQALEEDPYHAISYGYVADFLRQQGRNAEALTNLAKAIELDPTYTWAWRERAELFAQAGDHEAATTAWRTACELEPEAPINDGLRAFILRHQGRREAALPWLERAVERQPVYLWAWRERLELLLGLGRLVEAEEVGQRAIAAMPESATLHGMLAEAQRRLGQHDPARREQATERIAAALVLDGGIPQLWAIQAELAVERGDPALAEAAARSAVTCAERLGMPGSEYVTLLAQVLVAADRPGEAEELLATLLGQQPPPTLQPIWELAALLAERRGDLARARDLCAQALAGPLANDPRLRVRRARIGILLGEEPKLLAASLDPLFTADRLQVPWREAAHVFAQGGRPVEARRAGYLALELAGDEDARRRARVQLAEIELALGNAAGSAAALDTVLAVEPDHLQARILGAALADHRGDLPGAIGHLTHLDQRVRALLAGGGATETEPPAVLMRQLAALYERAGEQSRATQIWDRLAQRHADDGDLLAERAAFVARSTGLEPARHAIAAAEAHLIAGSPAHQRLMRELALAGTRQGEAGPGLRLLLDREPLLDAEGRLLLARLAVAGGEPATALRLLVPPPAGLDLAQLDMATVLTARAHLAAGDPTQAATVAEALWQRHGRTHEEAATILAECRTCQGDFSGALTVLQAPELPTRWALERALLGAVVALEEQGAPWALALLGRQGPPTGDSRRLPLVRIFATAWPGTWAGNPGDLQASVADLSAMPPFPRLAVRLAEALHAAGRHDLAATHLVTVLAFHRRHGLLLGHPRQRRLRLAAVDALCQAGMRAQALRLALAGASLRGLLRCCRP